MKQITLHKKIRSLYIKFPELIKDQRMLEFIMLTMYDDMAYVLKTARYDQLKYLLSDRRLSLNDFKEAPTVESITRAARYVREEMGIVPSFERLQEEMDYKDMYQTRFI